MRIALCLSGYFANAGGSEASILAHKYIKNKILTGNNVDVFVHSWDLENQQTVMDLYSPKLTNFEPQYEFTEELTHIDEDWFNAGFDRSTTMYRSNTIYRGLSQLLSRKKALEVKTEFEEAHSFKYDCVILGRFDLGTRGKEHPQVYYATNINFIPTQDMSHIYAGYWNQFNHGYPDHWFYSNSANMDLVGGLYDSVFAYYQPHSDYVQAVTTGWPESNATNPFSNEIELAPKWRSPNLKTHARWECIDNHKLYKWHFMQTGLHSKAKFVDIREAS
jgi:hypothetical protein